MGEAFVGATRRLAGSAGVRLLTNFYPRYGPENDQVDAVIPIQPVAFQRILPRYELSTSETRDTGLGPAFIEEPWLGRWVDVSR